MIREHEGHIHNSLHIIVVYIILVLFQETMKSLNNTQYQPGYTAVLDQVIDRKNAPNPIIFGNKKYEHTQMRRRVDVEYRIYLLRLEKTFHAVHLRTSTCYSMLRTVKCYNLQCYELKYRAHRLFLDSHLFEIIYDIESII